MCFLLAFKISKNSTKKDSLKPKKIKKNDIFQSDRLLQSLIHTNVFDKYNVSLTNLCYLRIKK